MLIEVNCIKDLSKLFPAKMMVLMHFKQLWCALGPRQSVGRQNSLKFNSVAVKDESTRKLARHRFFIENARKNMGEEQIFQRMYHIYFNGKKNLIGKMEQHIEQLQTKSF